jgi:hypothetical protein
MHERPARGTHERHIYELAGVIGLCPACGRWRPEAELPVDDREGRCWTCIQHSDYHAARAARAFRQQHAMDEAREEFSRWDKEGAARAGRAVKPRQDDHRRDPFRGSAPASSRPNRAKNRAKIG